MVWYGGFFNFKETINQFYENKKDFWRLTLFAYLFIFSGIILLYFIEEDSQFEIYFLVGVIALEVSSLVIANRALNVYHSLAN